MNKLLVSIFLLGGQIIFNSCHLQHDKEIICETNFKKARDLAYKNPTDSSALDSALTIVNSSMHCNSIKLEVVDLKIQLLLTLRKYDEGSNFIDSLQSSDFNYAYKKPLNHDNFIALGFDSKGDTLSRDRIYKKMAVDLESYIIGNNLKSKEFQEAFIYLNTLQEKFLDSIALKKIVDTLKMKYPEEERFLEFFKR